MRKLLVASILVLVVCSAAPAGEFIGTIRKIEDGQITVAKMTKDKKGKEIVLTAAKKIKVNQLKINIGKRKLETSKPFPDGLKNKALQNIGKKGIPARIVTNNDNEVTQITLFPKGFKIRVGSKKKDKKDG